MRTSRCTASKFLSGLSFFSHFRGACSFCIAVLMSCGAFAFEPTTLLIRRARVFVKPYARLQAEFPFPDHAPQQRRRFIRWVAALAEINHLDVAHDIEADFVHQAARPAG